MLLIVGETGSGKTTLINAMTTYLMGINFEDKIRIKLIKNESTKYETQSQTKYVTIYYLKSRKIARPIIFIDTPGFGDTYDI